MADSVIVGRFVGEDALAAVGASYALTNVFISIATGGGIGASVITGRAFGRRDYDRMKRSISTALLSFLALSLLLGTFGLLFIGTGFAFVGGAFRNPTERRSKHEVHRDTVAGPGRTSCKKPNSSW